MKANPQRVVEIPEPMCVVQNLKAVSTAQISYFYLLSFESFRVSEMGKIGKPQICRPTLHRFFLVKKLNKKNNCLKMSTVSTLIDARKFKRKTKTFLCS